MSIFNYTLPSGATFTVRGPTNATQAQADQIFYSQVAAGGLVGYAPGQTLTSPATKVVKFDLSRLDRGIAGVDNTPILAIIQGLPIVSGVPNLTNVPLKSPVDQADVILAKGDSLGADSIGPLSSSDVQSLLAQTSNLVDQNADVISQDKGIGIYGFTCYALEQAGYVKPGTSLAFFSNNPEDFVEVMSSPSVWTGLNGVYSLNDLLSNPQLQTSIQTQLMSQGYNQLLATGVITEVPAPSISVSTGQVYTNSGLSSISALAAVGGNLGSLSGILQNANMNGSVLNSLLSTPITNLTTISSGAVSGLSSLSSLNFSSLSSGLASQVTGEVGALITNASKFGSAATTLWANSGGLAGLGTLASSGLTSLSGSVTSVISGGLTGITNTVTGLASTGLNSITTSLTNLVPGSLSNLTSNLDIFGKASQFATNFSNPLTSLNNLGSLSSLGNLGSLNLGSLSNLNLSSLSSLGNLGSLINIGSLGSLFGGGGDLVSGTQVAGGYNNTVNRQTVDAAFSRILGSSKIPLPTYEYPSLPSIGARLDIAQAQSILQASQNPSNQVFGSTVTI